VPVANSEVISEAAAAVLVAATARMEAGRTERSAAVAEAGSTERFSLGRAETAAAMAKTVAAVNLILIVE